MKNKTTKQQIIQLLKTNSDGLTMSKLSQALQITPYKLNTTIYVLESQGIIAIVQVGVSKLVKLK